MGDGALRWIFAEPLVCSGGYITVSVNSFIKESRLSLQIKLKGGSKMEFEKYFPGTKVYPHNPNPYLHFSKGHAWINEAGVSKYFSGYEYIEFLFCHEKNVVGLIPVHERTEASLKLSRSSNGNGRFISMQGFYRKFPIRKITKRLGKNSFLIVESEDSNCLLVYLG